MVFIEIKNKIDLDVTYFKAYLTIIKFPTLKISMEWGGVFTYVPYNILRSTYIFMLQGVAALKLKDNLYFLSSLHTQSNKHIFFMNSIYSPQKMDEPLSNTTFVSCMTFNLE